MYWVIGIVVLCITLVIIISHFIRKERRAYMLKWEVDDLVRINSNNAALWFRELLQKAHTAKQIFQGYSASVVKIKKWGPSESLIELANGDSYFITTSWIDENLSCDKRLKLGEMDAFMKQRNPDKQEKREETLNELLEKNDN